MNDKCKAFMEKMLKVGTPECAIFSGVVAMVAAIFILLLGFWETVLVAILALLGVFVGGVKDKKEWLRNGINRLFPAKTAVPYKAEDVNIHKESAQEETDKTESMN